MNIEKLIKDNKDELMTEPTAGHRKRFAARLQVKENEITRQEVNKSHRKKILYLGITSAAAAILLIMVLINKNDFVTPYIYEENPQVAEMRRLYETQINETITLLENVLKNVDDSTRNDINRVMENLSSTTDLLANIAPLPEEKQLAITSQVYSNKLQTLNSIYRKINKK